jgi:hypothetical protein
VLTPDDFKPDGCVLVNAERLTAFSRAALRDDPLRQGIGNQVGSMLVLHTTTGTVPGVLIDANDRTVTIAATFDALPKVVPPTSRYLTVVPVDQILRVDVFCAHHDDWPASWVGRKGQLGYKEPPVE